MIFLPYQDIFLWAMSLSFIISLVYRLFTKPHEMRQIKQDMKLYREKSKEAQKNKDLKKANEYMSEMMKLSQKQMRSTMKPMILTLFIVVILLGFVSSAYSGVAVETKAVDEKTATGNFSYGGLNYSVRVEKAGEKDLKVAIDANGNNDFSDDAAYSNGDVAKVGNINWAVSPESMNKTSMQIAVKMPFRVPLFGWTYLNWLMWYILISLPATWIFRKALGVE